MPPSAAQAAQATVPPSPIRMISTDFDGTLIGTMEGEQGLKQFVEMIAEHRGRNNLQWVINTGRSWDTLSQELVYRNFPFLPDWLVLAEREVYRIINEHPVGDYEWNQQCEAVHSELFHRVAGFWKELAEFITSQTGAEAMGDRLSPITVRARNTYEADRIHLFVNSRLSSYPGLAMMRNSIYFRFSHEHFHKGSALNRVQQHMGIDAAQTMVIGDHYNDLPMLDSEYARFIACPSNAIIEVKEHVEAQGGFVATAPESVGVVQAWNSFLGKVQPRVPAPRR